MMKDLKEKYLIAKAKATHLMETGDIAAYFQALLEMKYYKKRLVAILAN